MRGAELYDRVINWPSPAELTMMFGAAVVLITLAALLLSIGRLRVFARILGVLGMATIMVALFVIHEQSDKEKIGRYVTVTRMRYPEPTRFQIRVALLALQRPRRSRATPVAPRSWRGSPSWSRSWGG